MQITRPVIGQALSGDELAALADGNVAFGGMTPADVQHIIDVQTAAQTYRRNFGTAEQAGAERQWRAADKRWVDMHPGTYDLRVAADAHRFATDMYRRAICCSALTTLQRG